MEFRFEVSDTVAAATRVVVHDPLLVVVGFAGRDSAAVQDHVYELQRIGAPAPARVPSLYVLPSWLLQVAPAKIQVSTTTTSGEVEPVLIRTTDGELFVTVGSDHTDRALERVSYGASKSVCPKVVAGTVWPLASVQQRWNSLRLQSVSDADEVLYQDSPVTTLREPADILSEVDGRINANSRPLVAFMGTVPVAGDSFRYASTFSASLRDADRGLECSYRIETIDPHEASLHELFGGNQNHPVDL